MSDFRTAYLHGRGRIAAGEDPEQVVPMVLAAAEAAEEISMAESLYGDREDGE
jgi:hypothetical protein